MMIWVCVCHHVEKTRFLSRILSFLFCYKYNYDLYSKNAKYVYLQGHRSEIPS